MPASIRAAAILFACLQATPPASASSDVLERDGAAIANAIAEANAGGNAVLRLDADSIYLLDRTAVDGQGLPLLRGHLRIEGHGASIRGYPGIRQPLFHVAPGARLELEHLTLAEAAAGVLLNHGQAELSRVVIEDNTVVRAPALVVNHGLLRIMRGEVRHNLVVAGRRLAGTLLNFGHMEVIETGFQDNAIDRAEASVVVAGAVLNAGDLEVESVVALGNRPLDEPERRGYGEIVNIGSGRSLGADALTRSGARLGQPSPTPGEPAR
jgi:hypothetical protein